MKSAKTLVLCIVIILLTLVVAPSAQSSTANSERWGYKNLVGPKNWGNLSSEFTTCNIGKQQSPIDIAEPAKANLKSIEFDYKSTSLKIINNGHTIQVAYEPGSSIKIDGKQYELLQFHFHNPSEHTVRGKTYPLEAHLVHKANDGELAVIGVFMKRGSSPNDFLQTLWANLPAKVGEKTVRDISLNANALLPADKSYYHYSGSLTTPPCSEGVNWIVLTTPIEISQGQIGRFTTVYSENARPIQPLNRRVIEAQK